MCAAKEVRQDGGKQKVSFTLDSIAYAWLKARAKELDRSMSWVINDWLKRQASG